MNSTFSQALSPLLHIEKFEKPEVFTLFEKRIKEGKFTKEENQDSHFGAFIVPYDPVTKQLFIVDHKKAKKWLFPGGHVDYGETIFNTVKRESKEELGLSLSSIPEPFFFSHMMLPQPYFCVEHFDCWFLIKTEESLVTPDMREFHHTKWVSFLEVKKYLQDRDNHIALNFIEKLL